MLNISGSQQNAMTVADRKMYWNLVETLRWIGTRDEGRTTAMGNIENNRTPLAMFSAAAASNPHQLLLVANYDFTSNCEPVAWLAGRKSLEANEPGMLGPGRVLNYLLQQAHRRRIRMTAIK